MSEARPETTAPEVQAAPESQAAPEPAAERPLLKSRLLLLALAVLALDQWSKWLVELHLPLFSSVGVIPGLLSLTHVTNTGVAFGLFAAHGDATQTWTLAAVGLLALTVVLAYFWRTPPQERLLLVALALVAGGAVGNLVDRVAAGAVTDFIDFYVGTWRWHTFNVADSAITIGLVLMAWDALRPRRKAAPATATQAG
jgi:signal peptidase II